MTQELLPQAIDPRIYSLYDEYCHGAMDRREFLAKAGALLIGGMAGADRIAHLILHPNARELLGSTTQAGVAFEHHLTELGLDMEEIEIGPSSRWINRPVGDVELAAAGIAAPPVELPEDAMARRS